MPDRDYLGNGKTRGWGAAINLLSTEGARTETVTAVSRALAAGLRRDRIGQGLDEGAFRQSVGHILEQKLIGPARYQCLESVGIEEFERRERTVRDALLPDISQMFAQVQRGKAPTAPPRRRLSAEETAAISISTLLSPEKG